jgi:hypothetical protein
VKDFQAQGELIGKRIDDIETKINQKSKANEGTFGLIKE